MTSMTPSVYANQFQLIMTGFLQFFFVSVWLFGYLLLWLTGHSHGLFKTGPKAMTRLDLKALLAREHQRSIKKQIKQLFTHLARENQREKSKVFPTEGVTIYNQPCDNVGGTSPHWEVSPLKQAH
jgi:hypothetical protein